MLKVKDLNLYINKKHLLKDISIDAQSSYLNIILGPNGAGKSTFLKSIAKIIDDFSGEIVLDDEMISEQTIAEVSKKIAYMGQFNSGSNLSVLEVLELSRRKFSGMSLSQDDHKIISTHINELDLEKFLHRNIDTLSGGERQKIFLAAALIQEPKVLLLDEPISHLDPKNQIEILEIIKKKTKQNDLITFVVLHDLQNSLHYGDNIMMLKEGELIEFKECADIDEDMINKLYGINCELFWKNGHPFTFFKHTHMEHHHKTHSHKEHD